MEASLHRARREARRSLAVSPPAIPRFLAPSPAASHVPAPAARRAARHHSLPTRLQSLPARHHPLHSLPTAHAALPPPAPPRARPDPLRPPFARESAAARHSLRPRPPVREPRMPRQRKAVEPHTSWWSRWWPWSSQPAPKPKPKPRGDWSDPFWGSCGGILSGIRDTYRFVRFVMMHRWSLLVWIPLVFYFLGVITHPAWTTCHDPHIWVAVPHLGSYVTQARFVDIDMAMTRTTTTTPSAAASAPSTSNTGTGRATGGGPHPIVSWGATWVYNLWQGMNEHFHGVMSLLYISEVGASWLAYAVLTGLAAVIFWPARAGGQSNSDQRGKGRLAIESAHAERGSGSQRGAFGCIVSSHRSARNDPAQGDGAEEKMHTGRGQERGTAMSQHDWEGHASANSPTASYRYREPHKMVCSDSARRARSRSRSRSRSRAHESDDGRSARTMTRNGRQPRQPSPMDYESEYEQDYSSEYDD